MWSSPASAAELKILAPVDMAVLRGAVEFKIQPVDAPTDRFLENPYVSFEDSNGRLLQELRAPRNRMTGICSVIVDTTRFQDGVYQAKVRYRTLVNGRARRIEEGRTVAIRNQDIRPVKFSVMVESREYAAEEPADLKVRVLDVKGRPMAGARVTFKSDVGDLESEAQLTDKDGEAFIGVENEDGGPMTVTITVENLPPVKKVIRFKPPG
jgi:hypothetical protein